MRANRARMATLAGASYALGAGLLAQLTWLRGSGAGWLAGASWAASAASGLVAGWGAAHHDRRQARRGEAREPVGSVVVGWTIALCADLLAVIALVVTFVVLMAHSGGFVITDY